MLRPSLFLRHLVVSWSNHDTSPLKGDVDSRSWHRGMAGQMLDQHVRDLDARSRINRMERNIWGKP